MSNVLVLGSEGYIGTELCKVLKRKNHKITGVDLGLFGQRGYIKRQDYRELPTETIKNADAIVVLAGFSSVALCEEQPNASIKSNVYGFRALLERVDPKKSAHIAVLSAIRKPSGPTPNLLTMDRAELMNIINSPSKLVSNGSTFNICLIESNILVISTA